MTQSWVHVDITHTHTHTLQELAGSRQLKRQDSRAEQKPAETSRGEEKKRKGKKRQRDGREEIRWRDRTASNGSYLHLSRFTVSSTRHDAAGAAADAAYSCTPVSDSDSTVTVTTIVTTIVAVAVAVIRH